MSILTEFPEHRRSLINRLSAALRARSVHLAHAEKNRALLQPNAASSTGQEPPLSLYCPLYDDRVLSIVWLLVFPGARI